VNRHTPDTPSLRAVIADERGIALVMSMFTLVLLMSLTLAFISIASTEPTIASNHMRTAQARAFAESGVEMALWAVINPAAPGAVTLPTTIGTTAPSPYNGGPFWRVGPTGGFTVAVVTNDLSGATVTGIKVTSIASRTLSSASTTAVATSQVTAQYAYFPDMSKAVPCALCVRNGLALTGNSNMDGAANASTPRTDGTGTCGYKAGAWTTGGFSRGGNANVNATRTPTAGTDYLSSTTDPAASDSAFSAFAFNTTQLATLKALAKANGTYMTPASSGGSISLSGVPNGLVFIDTFEQPGANADCPSSAALCLPNGTTIPPPTVSAGPGSFADGTGFHGWLIVNGNLTIRGNFGGITGLTYASGTLSMAGMGGSGIAGAMVVRDILNTGAGFTPGNANVTFDCNAISSYNPAPIGWSLVKGTYNDKGN
jgi:Tfp pilus assembly protein PilX